MKTIQFNAQNAFLDLNLLLVKNIHNSIDIKGLSLEKKQNYFKAAISL